MKVFAGTVVMACFLGLPNPILALGEEAFGNKPAVKQPDWADGVVDVVNLKSRVYSQWVNGNENFFYRGNAQALNEALKQFAAVKDDVRELILLPGSGQTQTFHGKQIDFNWQFHVPSGIYRAVSKKTHAVMTVYVNGLKPRGNLDGKKIAQWFKDLENDAFDTRQRAEQELLKLGKDAKPFLQEALKGQLSLEARRRVESVLETLQDFDVADLKIPPKITVFIPDDLITLHMKELKDLDATRCAMAIQELSALAAYSDKIVPALTDMLNKDRNEYVRRVAAACLAHSGVQAKSAIPTLKAGLTDPDANIRAAFQTAIDQLEKAKDPPGEADESKRKALIWKEITEFKDAVRAK